MLNISIQHLCDPNGIKKLLFYIGELLGIITQHFDKKYHAEKVKKLGLGILIATSSMSHELLFMRIVFNLFFLNLSTSCFFHILPILSNTTERTLLEYIC